MERERHPKGFKFIFFGELAERASYYGAGGLLAMYLTTVMGYPQEVAGPIKHIWSATCYILPILGGYVADRWLGKFRTIIYWSLPYILGHIVLGEWQSRVGLFLALALLAIGSGVIKPNISPLMGMMYDNEGKSKELRGTAFTWFYASINIGAASTMWTLPWVRDHYGYSVAFMTPAVLMAVSFVMFVAGRKHYPKEEVRGNARETPEEKREKWQVLKDISGIFALFLFFWAIFDQAGSTWVFFAQDYMNLYGMAPDMLQGLNPVLVVVLAPLFALVWKSFKKRGREFTMTQKMTFGFGLVVVCMGVMAAAGIIADTTGGKVSVVWEMVAYVIITMAEICVSVVGLDMAYTYAPTRLKSFLTGVFLAMVFVGNLLAGMLSNIYPKVGPAMYFSGLTAMMLVVAVMFYRVGLRFDERKGLRRG